VEFCRVPCRIMECSDSGLGRMRRGPVRCHPHSPLHGKHERGIRGSKGGRPYLLRVTLYSGLMERRARCGKVVVGEGRWAWWGGKDRDGNIKRQTDKMCCSGHSPVILGVQRAHSAVRSNAGVARRVENVARAFCGNNSDD